jgi:hypothetical protein
MAAGPPEQLLVDEKFLREYYILNCVGLLITTNHLTDGLYLPAEDRRHYVAWSNLTPGDFADQYWAICSRGMKMAAMVMSLRICRR